MPGYRGTCVYKNCTSSRKENKNVHFYGFPAKRPEICDRWVANAGNPLLVSLTHDELAKKSLCDKHFGLRSFKNSLCERLNWNAIPFHYKHDMGLTDDVQTIKQTFKQTLKQTAISKNHHQLLTEKPVEEILNSMFQGDKPVKTYSKADREAQIQALLIDHDYTNKIPADPEVVTADNLDAVIPGKTYELSTINWQSEPKRNNHDVTIQQELQQLLLEETKEASTKKLDKLKVRVQTLEKRLKKERTTVCRLKNKLKSLESAKPLKKAFDNASEDVQTFVYMLCMHGNRTAWRETEKEMAIMLYEKSPKCYKLMRNKFKFNLPSLSSIRIFLSKRNTSAESQKDSENQEMLINYLNELENNDNAIN